MSEIHVNIGQVKLGKGDVTLKALLGSCVGIGILWPEANRCALAHCLLPLNPVPSFAIDARFVDQAIPSLLALLKARPENFGQLKAVVAGGGNMTSPSGREVGELVGENNSRVALKLLKERGIPIVHVDVGGEEGRRISVNCRDFTFEIQPIPRII